MKRLVIERGAVEGVDHLVPGPPSAPDPPSLGSTNPALGALRGGVFVWVENADRNRPLANSNPATAEGYWPEPASRMIKSRH